MAKYNLDVDDARNFTIARRPVTQSQGNAVYRILLRDNEEQIKKYDSRISDMGKKSMV